MLGGRGCFLSGLVVALLWVLVSCQTHREDEGDFLLRFNISTGVQTLDPAFARDQTGVWLTTLLFDRLVEWHPERGIVPSAALRWEVDSGGLVYRFWLRGDLRFHDDSCFEGGRGRRVTAADFVYSFRRLMDPATASPGAWIFTDRVDDREPFTAVGDSMLIIRLREPFTPFLYMLTMAYASVVPREAIEKYGKEFDAHPVGSGPFRVAHWSEEGGLVLERVPHFRNPAPASDSECHLPTRIHISLIREKNSEFMEFLQGRLDIITGLTPQTLKEILAPDGTLLPQYAGQISLYRREFLNTEYVGFVVDSTLLPARYHYLLSSAVRRALALAIDRRLMLTHLRAGVGIPGEYGFVPPALLSEPSAHTPFDPEGARQLLTSAGMDPAGLPPIPLHTTHNYLDYAQFIAYQWEQNLGIKTELQVVDAPTLREWVAQGKVIAFRGSWIADYPDPESFLVVFKGDLPAPPNYTRYRNPVFDSLYRIATHTQEQALRHQLYRTMDSIVTADAPVIVLFYDESIWLAQKHVVGVEPDPLNNIGFFVRVGFCRKTT